MNSYIYATVNETDIIRYVLKKKREYNLSIWKQQFLLKHTKNESLLYDEYYYTTITISLLYE